MLPEMDQNIIELEYNILEYDYLLDNCADEHSSDNFIMEDDDMDLSRRDDV